MLKKIILSFTLLFFQITNSSAVELTVTNDISNIFNSKKICVRLSLNQQDQGIYSNSLNFSIDHPEITMVSWECKQNPTMQYVTKFKRVKKLYMQPLTCEITLNFEAGDTGDKKSNTKTVLKNLRESSLYISCIVLDKNGTSQPVSLVKALDDGFSLLDTATYDSAFNNPLNYDSIKTFTQNYLNSSRAQNKNSDYKNQKFSPPQKPTPETANIIIDNVKIIWGTFVSKLKNFFMSLNYILLYLLIFILMILLFFKKLRPNNIWLIEIRRFLVICWILGSYSFLNIFMPPYIFFTIFAILITPISMYYIFTARTDSTLDKLKSLLGFALAMSTLPLLIKAYLSFMFS